MDGVRERFRALRDSPTEVVAAEYERVASSYASSGPGRSASRGPLDLSSFPTNEAGQRVIDSGAYAWLASELLSEAGFEPFEGAGYRVLKRSTDPDDPSATTVAHAYLGVRRDNGEEIWTSNGRAFTGTDADEKCLSDAFAIMATAG